MIANTTKYGIKALMYLAKVPDEKYVQVLELSKKINVPGPYLGKIIKALARQNIVLTKKGALGGVTLPTKKRKITLYEICSALQDPVVISECFLSGKTCSILAPCPVHNKWKDVREAVIAFLKTVPIS